MLRVNSILVSYRLLIAARSMAQTYRILLDRNGSFLRAYWVRRRVDSIHAWCEGMFQQHSGVDLKVEYHYTYPADGDLHTSVRVYGRDASLLAVMNYYADRVKIKHFVNGVGLSSTEIADPERDPIMIRAAGYRPPPLSEYTSKPHFFGFPTMSLTAESDLSGYCTVHSPRRNDLVVPLTDGILSLSVTLRGLGNDAPGPEPPLEFRYACDTTIYPHIFLTAIVAPG
jgi:hypothetical protein